MALTDIGNDPAQALIVEANELAAKAERLDIEKVDGRTWDKVASEFDQIAQEQLFSFAHSRWPGVDLEPVLFREKGEVVGGTMMMVQPLPLKLADIAVCKWGPVLKDVKSADKARVYASMVRTLVDEYADRRGMMLSVLPKAVPAPRNFMVEVLEKQGFARGSGLLFPSRYIVNLRLDDEAQKRSFAQKWRYHLNKSLKADLTFEHGDATRLREFDALYQAMSDRKRFADHSAYDTITTLFETDIDAVTPELFFVREGGEVIAGAIIFKAGDTAVYLYGATVDRALPLRAGYFLHWHIIRWLRDNTRATWYDLGGTDGFQGLHQFKKGMVGTAGHIEPVPPVMNYASHFRAQVVGNLAYWARDSLQKVRHQIEKYRSDLATPDQSRDQ
ncbi:MAG: peptidoglycan bridge formation glycyltransferase FemA/FemB family protein [Hyphomicrobiaceae bacterium]|nr:peptidoglycan bridge formation glycyltransferase FemA/FemB family protein [Hyphomicrobiaceae bacterium]MCC0024758.1 peptidoglycan bridge formation glycyltransferase FemA/FemB family protein [Hyphomicrobiaceae bacterium]